MKKVKLRKTDDGIKRFPRLLKDYPEAYKNLTKTQRIIIKKASGLLPRGYDKLSKKQKFLIRLVINGMSVMDACKKTGIDNCTYYRYMNHHPLFRTYYLKYGQRVAGEVEGRLDAKLGRAVRVVEETLDGPDPYHRHEAAIKLLAGRGRYKKVMDEKVSGMVDFRGAAQEKPVNEKLVFALVDALKTMASGGKAEVRPKIIDMGRAEKIIEQLPPPGTSIIDDGDSKVQEKAKTGTD